MSKTPDNVAALPLGSRFRGAPAKGLSPGAGRIEREGGKFGAGVIRGAAMLTRGEAQGHKLWVDSEMVSQTVAATNNNPNGLKGRFTHPGLSSDGLGTHLGRWFDAVQEGDTARGDLHLLPAATETPDGNLAAYVLNLAEQDPGAFGASIVFSRDKAAEDMFQLANRNEAGDFVSPDPLNAKGYPHARLKTLHAADVVDEPAANPSGLFHKQHIAHEADALCAYALGLAEQPPELVELDADPERIAAFARRFIASHGLQVVPLDAASGDPEETPGEEAPQDAPPPGRAGPEETPPADPPPSDPPADDPPADPAAAVRAELARYVAAFGAERGAAWFAEGLAWEAALARDNARLRADLDQRDAQLADLRALQAQGFERGESSPVSLSDETASAAPAADRFSHLPDGIAKAARATKLPRHGKK